MPNFGNKIGDNAVILTNKNGDEIKTLYPINTNPENLFRTIFNKNSLNVLNQMNFLAKNYRPKCDICLKLCNLDWYMQKNASDNKDALLLCENCFDSAHYPRDLTKEDFLIANFFNIVNPTEKFHAKLKDKLDTEKWTIEETMELIDALDKHGENWDEVVKVFFVFIF